MAIKEHIEALKSKHATIDQEIQRESLRPYPDDLVLARLKREKLKLKEEIQQSHSYY